MFITYKYNSIIRLTSFLPGITQLDMMKSVVLFLFVIGIGIVTSANIKAPTAVTNGFHHAVSVAGTRIARQAACNVPDQCVLAVASLGSSSDLETIGRTICSTACEAPLLEFYERCAGAEGQFIATFLMDLCEKNSDGDFCFRRSEHTGR